MVPNSLPRGWVVPDLDGRGNGSYGLLHLFYWRRVAKFKAEMASPQAAQKCALDRVLDAARGTNFGASHGLEQVKTYREFCRAVPVRSSVDFESDLRASAHGNKTRLTRHPISSFVKTSGTTGEPKLLPVTAPWSRVVQNGQLIWTMGMLKEQEAVSRGKVLTTLGRVVEGRTEGGESFGSNTGRMGATQPWYVRQRWAIPHDVADIVDPEVRHYALLRMALSAPVSSWTTANPSMILALCRRLQEWEGPLRQDLRDGTLTQGPGSDITSTYRARWKRWLRPRRDPDVWTPIGVWNLATVNCWTGGPARYFVDRLPAALGGRIPIRDVGITASEGYFAFPLHSSWRGGVAHVGGHLLELKSETDGSVRPIFEGEVGETYRLIVSTTAGLYRYDMNDLVEVVGRYYQTPVLRFLGKSDDVSSVLGEKVTVEQVSLALAQILPSFYGGDACVSVEMDTVPRYHLCVEGHNNREWAESFDVLMKELNSEYASKRESGRLGSPGVYSMPVGTLRSERQRKLRDGASDGQVKDTLIVSHADVVRWSGSHAVIPQK